MEFWRKRNNSLQFYFTVWQSYTDDDSSAFLESPSSKEEIKQIKVSNLISWKKKKQKTVTHLSVNNNEWNIAEV